VSRDSTAERVLKFWGIEWVQLLRNNFGEQTSISEATVYSSVGIKNTEEAAAASSRWTLYISCYSGLEAF
jgi:hypothetical protein